MLNSDTPASRKKVVLLGNAIFIPVLLWFISAYAMATNLFGCSIWGGLFAGGIAALFIFLIERSIILASGNKWICGFRIIMGFCIATIGSILVDECLFKGDIDRQMTENKEMAIKEAEAEVLLKYGDQLANLDQKRTNKSRSWQIALNDTKLEADGNGGSRSRGVGKITDLKNGIADAQHLDYLVSDTEYKELLQKSNDDKLKASAIINSSYSNNMLLNRIKALFQLVFNNKIMAGAYLIITLLIWCMEFIVILFKIHSNVTNFERKVSYIEEMGESRMKKIVSRDADWYEAGRSHGAAKEIRQEIKARPPAFYN